MTIRSGPYGEAVVYEAYSGLFWKGTIQKIFKMLTYPSCLKKLLEFMAMNVLFLVVKH